MAIFLGILAVLLLLFFGVGSYFYRRFLHREGGPSPTPEEELALSIPHRRMTLESADGLTLRGYLYGGTGERCAIVVHGYRSRGSDLAAAAARFLELGFDVLLLDLRAHGESEGSAIGMGALEKGDLSRWISWLVERNPGVRIVLYGVSMGAATVLLTAGGGVPPQVRAVVADCGYTSAREEFSYELRMRTHLPVGLILLSVGTLIRLRAGWRLSDTDVRAAVRTLKTPTLFLHGEEDRFVPFPMGGELYHAAGCEKRFRTFPGARHAECAESDPERYWAEIEDFLRPLL